MDQNQTVTEQILLLLARRLRRARLRANRARRERWPIAMGEHALGEMNEAFESYQEAKKLCRKVSDEE